MMAGSFSVGRVRQATKADIQHMTALAKTAYAAFPVDWRAIPPWLDTIIGRPDILAYVAPDAAVIANVQTPWFWRPLAKSIVVLFAAGVGAPWALTRCLDPVFRAARDDFSVSDIKIDAETGKDLGPLVRRLAKRYNLPVVNIPAYTVRLR